MTYKKALNEVLKALIDAVIVVDEDLKIIQTNRAIEEMSDRTEGELLNRPLSEILLDLQQEFDTDLFDSIGLEELIQRGLVKGREVTIVSKDGHKTPVLLSASKLSQQNHTICVAKDISSLKWANSQLNVERERSLNNSKLAALGEMAAGIGHEMKNPLTIILGYAHRMQTHMMTLEPDEIFAKGITKIVNATNRMDRIISGMQNIARDDGNDEFEEVSLTKLVDETLSYCELLFAKQKVNLKLHLPPDLFLVCKEVQISQMILNILNNAVFAVKKQEDAWIEIAATQLEDRVQISIQNNGPLITPAVAERLNEGFYTTKPRKEGTGLGLSICRSIAQHHSGSIRIDTSSGFTTFVIDLPNLKKQVA
jgi:PAS domain S-box-containing protein